MNATPTLLEREASALAFEVSAPRAGSDRRVTHSRRIVRELDERFTLSCFPATGASGDGQTWRSHRHRVFRKTLRSLVRPPNYSAAILLASRCTTLIDSLLTSSPTPGVERLLLADLSDVYSGYFVSLVQQGRNAEAFTIIEKAHRHIETQALQHHAAIAPHAPSGSEQRITQLNIRLINSDDPAVRAEIEQRIYQTKLEMDTPRLASLTSIRPVSLEDLQRHLEKRQAVA